MPIYQYKCEECERHFEELRSIKDDSPIRCKCGSENVYKVPSAHGGYEIKGNNSASTKPRRTKG